MAVNKLKCSNCNIVISEVLAFLQNKHDVMDNESLIRVCLSSFSETDIDDAKNLLFESLTTSQRKISRRKDGKKQRDLEDIICLLKETDPDLIPIFVARNLQKLPPVTLDHDDVTKLLKDLLLMRTEIDTIKEKYATIDFVHNQIKQESVNEKTSSYNLSKINTRKRGAFYLDSGPIGLTNLTSTDISASEVISEFNDLPPVNGAEYPSRSHAPVSDAVSVVPIGQSCASGPKIVVNKPTMAELVRRPGDWKLNDETKEEWTQVQRKKYRNRFIGQKGKAVTESKDKFKAAETKVPLFISNVNKNTSENDIIDYIRSKTKEEVSVEKVSSMKERPYNSYKLIVSKNRVDTFLCDSFWPDSITFRRFVHLRARSNNQHDDKTTALNVKPIPT